ncbi:hypothetical protein F5B22DRAFT_596839 [Xylaria bambusicola]|uniref:uncharacterized protein n=1 Tax=Xylaria bambusicola TaxID=326684 RepID=UPI0020084911|nr:uncharacterized protein F5B22DRAFT_596839 [Xylaria bambusicola]KAI0521437.1 hypothetical protein F5B22DRAFT_596839 [Xylaria bambusicola]
MLISTTASRLRPLHVHTGTAANPFATSRSSALRLSRPVQARAFRYGIWSSFLNKAYLHEAYERELRRGYYQTLKRKYANDMDKSIPWHEQPFPEPLKHTLKRAVARYCHWGPKNTEWKSPWFIQDEIDRQRKASSKDPENPSHIDGSKIRRQFYRQFYYTRNTPRHVRSQRETDTQPERNAQNAVQSKTDVPREEDYVIDPITNRKVSRRDPRPLEIDPEPSARIFNPNKLRPNLSNLDQEKPPVHSNGKPPASELRKYAENDFDDWPTPSTSESTKPSVHRDNIYDNSALKSEEYSLNHLPLDDPAEDYGDFHKNGSATSDKPLEKSPNKPKHYGASDQSGSQKPAQTKSSNQPGSNPDQLVNELRGYGPYMHNESSVTQGETAELHDLEKYRYRPSEEPEPTSEPSTPYDDLHEYVPTPADNMNDQNQLFGRYGGLEKYKAFRSRTYEAQASRDPITESPKMDNVKLREIEIPDISAELKKIPKMKLPSGYIFLNDASTQMETEALEFHDSPRNISRSDSSVIRGGSIRKHGRLNRGFGADLYSKEPQGLETSFAKECGGRNTMPLYTRTYGSEPGQVPPKPRLAVEDREKEVPERSSPSLYSDRDPEIDGIPSLELNQARGQKAAKPDEPTVYKILAYDPVSQTINIAETTSVVPDLASPLSPTEVLLRLSNPTRFLPHFAPLQAEGFEIVSGSGHVLVFRQVRPAKATAQDGSPSVNPIDMMGRQAAVPNPAAFVSPTGFVNYDIPRVEEEPVEHSSRSNVKVGREEAVFSGKRLSSKKNRGEKFKKPKMGVGERIIVGGVWVAGISYALGVVIEYFHTGGTDGKGPTGFSPTSLSFWLC